MKPIVSATIDAGALNHNLGRIRQWAPRSQVMAVIKANAYGHGLVCVARALDGADAFAVARVDEGLTLREAGVTKRTVLLVDLDPQGNATMGCGVDKANLAHGGTLEVLLGETPIESALVSIEVAGFTLLPSNQDLTAAEVRLLAMSSGREAQLKKVLAPVLTRFDVIVIDSPPALNLLTVNALVAADSVLVPMQCEYYALEGLSALMSTIEQIRAAANPQLAIEGILRTMFDPRNNLATEVSAQLIMHFGDKVFRTIIPRNIRLAEAPSFGVPVLFHDKDSRGALAYLALAGEMIRREEEEGGHAHSPDSL